MPTDPYTEEEEFFLHQIRTTMDIDTYPFMDWFHGGLNFQVVHHIWPRMARPHYRRANEMLREFCKDNKVDFTYVSLYECLSRIL
jgi:delta8-fatty-acid desaturase